MRKTIITFSVCLIAIISLVAGQAPFPRIGVAAIAIKNGKILVVKSKKTPPLKQLAFGESLSKCAMTELKRLSNLSAEKPCKMFWTSEVFDPLDRHYITVFVQVDNIEGEENLEMCEWVDIQQLPDSVYAAIKNMDPIAQIS